MPVLIDEVEVLCGTGMRVFLRLWIDMRVSLQCFVDEGRNVEKKISRRDETPH